MNDLISRQKAIEFLGEEPEVWCGDTGEYAVREQWRADVSAIKAVPSAEPQWIPVIERLPEKDGRYLITTFGIFKREYVEMAGFSTASKAWTQYDLEYGDVPVDDVIAWMPLPKPYRGDSE